MWIVFTTDFLGEQPSCNRFPCEPQLRVDLKVCWFQTGIEPQGVVVSGTFFILADVLDGHPLVGTKRGFDRPPTS